MFSSIKAKIITFYMAVLLVILSVLGVLLYFSFTKIVYDSIDSTLLSKATALATLVKIDVANRTEFNFSDEITWEYNSRNARNYFQIRRPDGTTLEKSASLENTDLPFPAGKQQTDFLTIRFKKSPVRLINFHIADGSLVIQCAEDIRYQRNLMRRYRIVLVLSLLSIVAISAMGGLLIASRALTPVKDISETIDKISESNLSERISMEEVPRELKVLASSFNRTFDQLEMAFIRQKQFAADASHELRTPLSVILSQSEIILRKNRTAAEYRDTLSVIRQAAALMSEIVRKVLAIAQLREDRVELRLERTDIGEIINDSAKLLRPLAEHRGISIDLPSDGPHEVTGDRSLLSELFSNLISNAIKYNVPNGKIEVKIMDDQGYVKTEICDTGIGIPEDDLDKVFDRFYRVDKSRSRESGGVGLGLSICKEIVKMHGGRIEINSEPGKGSTVSVYLKEQTVDIN